MPNGFIRTINSVDDLNQPIQVEHGIVIGPDGNRYYQETDQAVADLVHVGDVIRVSYHTHENDEEKQSVGKRIVVAVLPKTECTCNESFCANRIGDDHPAAYSPGEHCYLLKCWTIVYVESGRATPLQNGEYHHFAHRWLHEYVATNCRIVQMADDEHDAIEVVERGVWVAPPRQLKLL